MLAGAVAPAYAVRHATATSFGFGSSPDQFFGEVSSPKAACERGRRVRVFRVRPGDDALVGGDRTSSTGQWTVKREVPAARYYAKVLRKVLGPNRICRRYRSSTLFFS